MANDTTAAQPEQQEWNPVEAVKAKYPDMGMPDHEIAQTLQDPAKFRAAFPEYTDVTDDEIKNNVGKFVARHSEYSPSSTKRLISNAGSAAGVTSNEEGENFLKHPIDSLVNMGKGMLSSQKDTGNLAYKELGEGKYAAGAADLIDAAIPVLGPQLSKAGHQLENKDYAGGIGTTLGAGSQLVLGHGMDALHPEGVPVTPTVGRSMPLVMSKLRQAPADPGLAPHPGSTLADPLGRIKTPESMPASQTGEALSTGAKSSFYPKGQTPEDHALRTKAKGLATIAVPKVQPEAESGEALGTIPQARPAAALAKNVPVAKPAAATGESLGTIPAIKPAAVLADIEQTAAKPAAETGEALAGSPLSPTPNPLGSIKTPQAIRASESGEALATVPKSRSSELGIIPTPKALPASETGEALATLKVPDQPITPEVVAESKAKVGVSAEKSKEEIGTDQVSVSNKLGGSTFDAQGKNLSGKNAWVVGVHPELTETVPGDLTQEQLDAFKTKHGKFLDEDHAIGTWKNDKGDTVLDIVRTVADQDEAVRLAKENNQQAIYHLGEDRLLDTGGTGEAPRGMSNVPLEAGKRKGEEPTAGAVVTKPESKPNTPVGDTVELTEAEKRALAHRIGPQAASDLSPEGQDRATRFLRATNQQIADTANKLGIEKSGDKNWVAKDFSRSGAKGGDLNPNKKLVFEYLQNSLSHDELMDATKDWGPNSELMSKLKGKGPSPVATTVTARMSDAELKEHGFTQADIDAGKHLPPVKGGAAATTALANDKGIPEEISQHMTPEEIAGSTKTDKGTTKFVENISKIPEVQEYIDIALQGEGARKWYQRSSSAFDEMVKAAPDYFGEEGDKDKFLGMLSGSSPRQSVAMNLRESLNAWKEWVDAGRPELSGDKWKAFIKEAVDAWKEDGSPKGTKMNPISKWDYAPQGDDWATERMLLKNFTSANSKIPNIIKAMNGEELWPDLTKNANFKVPSFYNNLKGWLNSVTNDGWMSLFGGLDPRSISKSESYHPLSVATRAAAEALGWEPAEAQAAIWSFTQALTERGETDPNIIRQYSKDYADLMAHDKVTRDLLEDLGVNLDQLDERLKGVGEKPEVTGRTTATTSSSIGKLKERIEDARGRGTIPPPKSAQGELNFREEHPVKADVGTEFNPEKLEKESASSTPLTDKLNEQYGDKGKPLSTSFLKPDGKRIPVADHDVALEKVSGTKGGEESRQKYINDEKSIRQRFRTGKEGKEIVFSVPDKVTPEQIASLKESVKELGTEGVLSIERAQKGGPYFRTYDPTEQSVELGLQDIGVLPKERATTEHTGPLQEDTAEASAQSAGWRMNPLRAESKPSPLGHIKSPRGGTR